jgi:hypothetical protein
MNISFCGPLKSGTANVRHAAEKQARKNAKYRSNLLRRLRNFMISAIYYQIFGIISPVYGFSRSLAKRSQADDETQSLSENMVHPP